MNTKDAVVAYHFMSNVHKYYWYATVALTAHPYTRKVGLRMASYGARVGFNVARASAGAVLGTPLARGGTVTGGALLGAAAAGYVIGATVGTGIAQAGWGDEGRSDAIDLYTGQVSFDEYVDTVGYALGKTF